MEAPARPKGTTRPGNSMSLLTNIMDTALDEGYAQAAARRGAAQRRVRPTLLLTAGLLGVGLLLATSAAQVRDRAPAAAEARDALATEIDQRTAANDRLETDLDRLRADVARTRRAGLQLTREGAGLATRLARLEGATGAAAVIGPAVVVHLEEAAADDQAGADGDPRTGGSGGDGRVTDRDLQTVVNEVWAAGAEAVAVNGQRLTALSAIRSAGQAILVDFRPLSPPYDVVAVGDSDAVRTDFLEGFGGSYLQALEDYGITTSVDTRERVRLPASAGVTLRHAVVPDGKETDR